MVFDVPAESGGALTVLHDFYDEYKSDQKNEYIFVVSIPELQETDNIKVLRYPWIKKSWAHRFLFDHLIAPKLIKKYKIEKVLSLQNIIIPHTKVYQSVFVQNALPFSEHRFSFTENALLWVYQNIIGEKIKKSIKKADSVIVQTNWMKKIIVAQVNVEDQKIKVKRPNIKIHVKKEFCGIDEDLPTFFYPASGLVFKNHKVIIDSCLKLKAEGITNYKVIFTLQGNENEYTKELYTKIKNNNLPIEFMGELKREEVFEMYSKSILIFPSYIETVGLPLLEAKFHNCPIIASDSVFAHEILDGYANVNYFESFDAVELSLIIKSALLII